MEATQPANGGTEVLSGDRVRYTPDDAFGGGEDPFTYTLCETVDANGGKDCDSATVTVTVIGGRTRCRSTTPTRPPCGTSRCRSWSPRTTSSRTRPSWRSGPPRRTARPSSRNSPGRPHPVHPLRLHRHGQLHLRLLLLGGRRDRQGGLPVRTVTVDVTEPLTPPTIEAVTPNPTPPNREVEVTGTTGLQPGGEAHPAHPVAWDRRGGAGDRRLHGAAEDPRRDLRGRPIAELRVDCQGKLQADEETLEVANKAPDAVDDPASTPKDTPVTIPVADNDTDPDGDDGYQMILETAQPASGKTAVQPGNRVLYTPDGGPAARTGSPTPSATSSTPPAERTATPPRSPWPSPPAR